MKTERWTIHCIAWCTECGKEWQHHETARKQAYNHARATGHRVAGEQGDHFGYN